MATTEEKKAFAQTLKIALATSIIRTKPQHLTAKEYACQIAEKLKTSESSWKAKHDKLEKELRKAQEKIVVMKLRSQSSQHGNQHEIMEEESPQIVEVDDVDVSLGQENFLTTVLSLKDWSNKLEDDEESTTFVKKNMIALMKDVEVQLKNIRLDEHNLKCIALNLKIIGGLTKNVKFSSDIDIRKSLLSFIRTIVAVLMNSTTKHVTKEKVCNYLFQLATSCIGLRDMVMETLVLVIVGFTALLKELPSFTALDVDKYDNVGHVCLLLKEIVQKTISWSTEYGKFGNYSSMLDENLFEISGTFLPYAETVWNISSLIMETKFQLESKNSNIVRARPN